jgi:EmrB/QacA subfamily drug resistance transporter
VLLTCCLALFISTLDNTVANVALPSIGRDLGTSGKALQWVVAAYVVVRGCLLLSAGALGDRYGRRRVFQIGLVVFGIGSALCSAAPSSGALIAARVLQAIGGCVLVPSSLALITAAFPDRAERARAIGVWSATTGVSTGLGPVLGGVLVQAVGWRSVFWVNLPIVGVAVALAARNIPESRDPGARPLDVPGQALVVVLLVSLTSGFIEASDGDWTSGLVLGLLGVALVALTAFVALERRRRHPLLDPGLFRSPAFAGSAAIAVLAFIVFAGFLFVNVLYLQEVRGYSPVQSGLMLIPSTLGNVVLAPLAGRITAVRGPRLPVVAAGVLMAAGTLILAFAGRTVPVWGLLGAYALIGSGVGLVNAPITDAAVAGLPATRAGVAGAITSAFRQVGNALGVALLGTLAFTGFAAALPAGHRVAGGSAQEALRGAGGGPAGRAVGDAFVHGLHHAYLAAAALALAVAVVAALSFGRRADRQASAFQT